MSTISFSLVTPILENRPPGCVIVGVPGSGKSYFMLNLAVNSLMCGCRIFCLDAKNDMMDLREVYPDIEITDINQVEPGSLNPFAVLPDIDTNTVMSIISILCGNLSDEKMIAVQPIVQDFIIRNRNNKGGQSFAALADYLYASSNKEAQSIGSAIKINEDSAYGPLLLKPTHKKFEMDNESRIISLLGMPMPSDTNLKSELTNEERFSSAIIYIICKMLNNILKQDSSIPSVFMVDESHILFKSSAMHGIVEDFLVLGRSLNVATVLASQNISHFDEGLAQLVSNKFAFRLSKIEAERFVELFDNSSSEDNIERDAIVNTITNLKTGNCFFIDRKHRSGFIHIESNLGDVTSNPLLKKKNKKAEEEGIQTY